MPRFLVLYGTTDGHTAEIARFLMGELEKLGALVDVFDASYGAPSPAQYDGVIVAASIHVGGFQRDVVRWVITHRDELDRTHAVFLSVCLSVLQQDPGVVRELAGIINRFKIRTGWQPAATKLVAGALLYTRYSWLKRLAMRHIARKAGGGIDTSRDYRYTDWSDLTAFAREFHATHGGFPEPKAKPQAVGMQTCEI